MDCTAADSISLKVLFDLETPHPPRAILSFLETWWWGARKVDHIKYQVCLAQEAGRCDQLSTHLLVSSGFGARCVFC